MEDYSIIKSEYIYKGRRIEVYRDTLLMPDGKEAVRDLIKHNGAAAMIPVDNEGNIIFVKQYRHSAGGKTLEIPAGTLEKGELPINCAIRELEEETSYKAGKMTFLIKFYSAIGFCNEVIHVYVCEELEQGSFNTDEDEFIDIERYSLKEALDMIKDGTICDSKTMTALLAYKYMIKDVENF